MGDDLGLDKSVVALRPHNPRWIELGELECANARRLLGSFCADIRHIGSTAVPDLDAKPILDLVAAVVVGPTVENIVGRLSQGGDYAYEGDMGSEGGLLFVRGHGPFRTVHLHVVRDASAEWDHYIRFHDLLLADPQARAEYQREKHHLAEAYSQDRTAYTSAKHPIIENLLQDSRGESSSH
ncbi:MAG TPA: GrpB family protein [Acidimicrobiales bacterium]|nr:GrpB family protein [Acidimicrobiales bacterium]